MPLYRKKPVVIEAWLVRDLNRLAEHDWHGLPKSVRDDYEDSDGKGGWVFGALVEKLTCTGDAEHLPQDKTANFCSQCAAPVLREGRRGIYVPTLEGNLFAAPDDYIIRGVQGEFYPCKPDIFKQTYDSLDNPTKAVVRIDPAESEALEIRFLEDPPEVVVLRHGMSFPEGGEAVYSELLDPDI